MHRKSAATRISRVSCLSRRDVSGGFVRPTTVCLYLDGFVGSPQCRVSSLVGDTPRAQSHQKEAPHYATGVMGSSLSGLPDACNASNNRAWQNRNPEASGGVAGGTPAAWGSSSASEARELSAFGALSKKGAGTKGGPHTYVLCGSMARFGSPAANDSSRPVPRAYDSHRALRLDAPKVCPHGKSELYRRPLSRIRSGATEATRRDPAPEPPSSPSAAPVCPRWSWPPRSCGRTRCAR